MVKKYSFVLTTALSAVLLSTAARAGQCPADQIGVDVTKPVVTAAKGVTDTVLSAIDLSQEPANIAGRVLRLRKLVVQPGGVVPWHSHGDRPAIIYIVDGTITEYASNCAVPLWRRFAREARRRSGRTQDTTQSRFCPPTCCTMSTTTICDPQGRERNLIWRSSVIRRAKSVAFVISQGSSICQMQPNRRGASVHRFSCEAHHFRPESKQVADPDLSFECVHGKFFNNRDAEFRRYYHMLSGFPADHEVERQEVSDLNLNHEKCNPDEAEL